MGATNFGQLVVVKGDDHDAWRKAREEANEYNGHRDGYSGDIQTTSGYKLYTDAPRYGTNKFYQWEDKMLDKLGKWENCACVEVTGKTAKLMKESRGLKGRRGWRIFYFFGWGAS